MVLVVADIVDQAGVLLVKGCLADLFERLAGERADLQAASLPLGDIGLLIGACHGEIRASRANM